MECYSLWMSFKAEIDAKLDQFIAEQQGGLTTESIMESLERVNEIDNGLLSCIDYLLAAADYQDFVDLML